MYRIVIGQLFVLEAIIVIWFDMYIWYAFFEYLIGQLNKLMNPYDIKIELKF
jgi:hypothetical protein